MQSPTRQQRDAFEQLCLLRALYAHRGPLDRACTPDVPNRAADPIVIEMTIAAVPEGAAAEASAV